MTVQNTNYRADYTGNGVTVTFSVPFYFLQDSHIKVVKTDNSVSPVTVTTLALVTDYTVSGAGNPSGGTITLVATPQTYHKITILRDVPYTQLTHYVPNDPFPAASHEAALDQLTMEVQQLAEITSRAMVLEDNVTGVDTTLPTPQANTVVAWNSAGTALQNVEASSLATVVYSGSAIYDTFTGDSTTRDFTLSANPGALNNLQVSVGGVVQTPTTDFTWAGGTTLTFVTAPPTGATVVAHYQTALLAGTGDANTLRSDLASTSDATKGDKLIGVKINATGAVARTQHDKNDETVSIADFSGSPSASAVANSAAIVAALASGAKRIRFPSGTYNYVPPIDVEKDGISFIGDGPKSTYLVPTAVAVPAIKVGVTQTGGTIMFTMQDMRLTGNSTCTAGIQLGDNTNPSNGYVANVNLERAWIYGFNGTGAAGLLISRSWWVHLTATWIDSCYDGVAMLANGSTGSVCNAFTADGWSRVSGSTRWAFYMNGDGSNGQLGILNVNNTDISSNGAGVIYSNVRGAEIYFSNCYGEDNLLANNSGGTYYLVNVSGAATPNQARLRFDNCHIAANLDLTHGFYGRYVTSRWAFNRNMFYTADLDGTCSTYVEVASINATNDLLAYFRAWGGEVEAREYDIYTGKTRRYKSNGHIFEGHIDSVQDTAPTIAAGTGLGTGGTAVLASGSTDTAGQIQITCGASGWLNTSFATITFNKAYAKAPTVLLFPASSKAASQLVNNRVQVSATSVNGFDIAPNVAETASGLSYWNYIVIG